ncbi:MAG: hypothetical protein L6R35_000694 [Caloplaca aegaea]|nr:MAG: hypothetical protein L6R35_000694 [Caloplaca aegaea]
MQWTPMAFARKPAQQFVVVELQDGLLLTQSGLRESVGQDAAMSRLGFSPRHEDVLGASGVTEAEDGTLAHFVFTLAIDGFPRGRACKTARWAPDERIQMDSKLGTAASQNNIVSRHIYEEVLHRERLGHDLAHSCTSDHHLKSLHYGSGCVEQHLLSASPSPLSKVIMVTGTSLAAKTPLMHRLETLEGHHAGTVSGIRQHGPIADVERALEIVLSRDNVDTVLSLGGGSSIDTAKVISLRTKEKRGTFLTHLTIPTTLSAAECTAGGGYTQTDGLKVGFRAPEMGLSAIFYDAQYAHCTPKHLWLSTGMRAMDHAVESIYHPCYTEVPWKALSL